MAGNGCRLPVGLDVRHSRLPDAVRNLYTILAAVLMAAIVWTFWPREKPVVGESVALPPAKEVRTVEKIIYQPRVVYVYPEKSKSGLNLPKSLSDDPSKKLIATGKLSAEERNYTMSAILDETGNATIYARPDPLPWLSYGKRGAVGVAYGLQDGEMTGKVYAQHDLLQVKALHAGARAEIDQRGGWFAGFYTEYRW